MPDETAAVRREILGVCRRLWERGLIAGRDGNVSVRLPDGHILVTPAGMPKQDCGDEDLVVLTLDGRRVGGAREASTEVAVHLRIYRDRPDVFAVVHAHPPVATGFALAGETLPHNALPEIVLGLGPVALVHYETPGTAALANALEPHLSRHQAFLLANHGAVTVGPTLSVAYGRMESLEHTARIVLTARLLGRVNPLTPVQLEALLGARDR
ncbi:MAG TPA: class II aldolase/adducin family protein [Gemmatimonadaceae bacterium]|nr:class II aldolase/adducin family protein [Gemmatimonadaceae bacterium]